MKHFRLAFAAAVLALASCAFADVPKVYMTKNITPAGLVAVYKAMNWTPEGKVALLAAGTDAAVKAGFAAGNVIREIASKVGGRGGGKPAMAQAGGSDVSGIDAALDAARTLLGA